ncbi:MAG TPA: hypothetical protein VN809_02805 [Telmatospirillum sp.]|nr:hypothetical protein [Telmatospirillum sp.]
MSKTHPLKLIAAAALIMVGALIFGLYPEPSQTTVVAMAPSSVTH